MNRHSSNSGSDKMRLKRSDQPGSMNRHSGNSSGEQMRLRKSDARLEAMRHRTAEARALARAQEHNNANRVAFTYDPADRTTHADIGRMEQVCTHCSAYKFKGETKGVCCSNGKVVLEPSPALPPLLKELLSSEGPLSKHFLDNIQTYNGSFAMMSFLVPEARPRKAAIIRPNVVKEVLAKGTFA